MSSGLYAGKVVHQRLRPRRHRLSYRLFWMLFDLDDMPSGLRFFSHNGRNLLAFRDRDHLDGSATPLRNQIEQMMSIADLSPDGGPIRVLCMPRVLGSVFNPISVWFCHRRDETLVAMLYEVNNTFGERHCYLIPVAEPGAQIVRQSCDKAFYVSPFMRMEMTYDFRVTLPGAYATVIVDASDAEGKMIATSFRGQRRDLTDATLLAAVLRHGVLALKVLGAIHWEAAKLWLKGLRIQARPKPPAALVTIVQPHGG
jgi:DUF1365 family protein